MNYQLKIYIDRFLGTILCLLIALPVKLVDMARARGNGSQPKLSQVKNIKRIVVLKVLGMGSILQTRMMVRMLKQRFPEAKLTLVTSASNRVLTERLDGMFDDHIYLRDNQVSTLAQDTLRVIGQNWFKRPDLFINLEIYSSYASFLCGLSGASLRFGFYRDSLFYRTWLFTHVIFFNLQQHISASYAQMALAIGAEYENEWLNPLALTVTDKQEAQAWLNRQGLQEKYIVINVNSSELLLERRWPAESFAQLIQMISEQVKAPVVLMGSPSERDYVQHVLEKVPTHHKVLNAAGQFSLAACLALIQQARLMISNDSGPFHFAVSMQVPTIGLFGPCDPRQYGPPKAVDWVRVHYLSVYCSPCIHNTFSVPCGGNNICMQQIQVQDVLQNVLELWNSPYDSIAMNIKPNHPVSIYQTLYL